MDKAPDNKALAGSDIPFPFESEIGRRLTMGDIAYYDIGERKTDAELNGAKFDHLNVDHYNVVPKLNKLGKIPNRTSWDSFAYALMMSHNVYGHIIAVQRANHLADIESVRIKPDWRSWKKVKANDKSDEPSEWVPRNILYFNRFVEELFNTKTKAEAFEMIDQANNFLSDLEGARLMGGPSKNTFKSLFDFDVTHQNELDLANPDDDDLRALEESIDE